MRSSPSAGHSGHAVRRVALALVAATTALAASFWLAAPAQAATATLTVDRESEAWYWSSNQDIRQCSSPLPPPAPPDRYCTPQAYDLSATSPISPGHLGVSLKAGASDMRTYLFFDLVTLPARATINSFILQLNASRAGADADHTTTHGQPGGKAPATTNEDRASINACLVTLPWGKAEGGAPSTMNPDDPTRSEPVEPFVRNGIDCSVSVEGKQAAKWSFDLTEMAQRWASGKSPNNGVALLPNKTGPTDSWTVEFHGAPYDQTVEDPATGGTRDLSFVTTAEAPRVTVKYTAVAAPPPPLIDFGPTAPIGGGTTVVPPAPVAPEPVAEPVAPQSTTPAFQPVAQSNPRTPWYSWLMIPALAISMAGLSRAMGREIGEAGGNRVAAMVQRRRAESLGD